MKQNIQTLWNPTKARLLPINSPERAIASMALRNIWHLIYDNCPRLLQLNEPDGKIILDSFLQDAESINITFSWALHLHLITWLHNHEHWSKKLENHHVEELTIASTLRFMQRNFENISSLSEDRILLFNPLIKSHILGAIRSKVPFMQPTLFRLNLPDDSIPVYDTFLISIQNNSWTRPNWKEISC